MHRYRGVTLQAFGDREESGRRYTISSDSAAAIDRITTDRLCQAQRLAVEAIETCTRLLGRVYAVTVRWTPAHLGVEATRCPTSTQRGRPKA